MKKIRIGYFADGPWSHEAFKLLIKDSMVEVAFIVPRNDTTDETLKNYSTEYNIDYLEKVFVNSDEFFQLAKSYNCDLFVSMSYNQIFKNRIINLPPKGTINCHAGKLPFYRGRNILNWALINDEKEFGITVHFVDEGIDTGDIILQKSFPISDQDDYSTLLKVSHFECANVLYEAIQSIYNDDYTITNQADIHPYGFYCGMRRIGDEVIDWNQSSRDLFNFIRAICVPGPSARTTLNGVEIKINNSRYLKGIPEYKGVNGQVIGKTNEGFLVKTKDTYIEILEVSTDSKIKVGDRFK